MSTQISGTAITVGSIDLTTPLATADGGTGSSTISPYQMVLGTAQATTSGTAINFTGIPSWVKRITMMFNNVSASGTSSWLIQLGDSGGIETTGYLGSSLYYGGAPAIATYTTGFALNHNQLTLTHAGSVAISLVDSLSWVAEGNISSTGGSMCTTSGSKSLSGVLDRIRLTTVNGIDTFDAGSVNIMYEGY